MADDKGFFDKLKDSFKEDEPKPYKPVPGVDKNKAESFMKGFSGESSNDSAMNRRMAKIKGSY